MNLMISKIPLRHRSAAIAAMQADVAVDILSYVIGKSALGRMLVARSVDGVCAILIGADQDELKADLGCRFPQAILVANEAVVQLLPLPPQPGNAEPADAPWWDSAQLGPPPPSPRAERSPAPDLSTYLASTFIAQCPRCGAFRLDIARARSGWDFRCESCEYVWTWQPGTPWPPVRVMPGRRKESRPPPA